MEPGVEARFQRIESLLHAMAEGENRMDIRFDRKHAQAMQSMDRREAIANRRMDRNDKLIKATANLVREGTVMMKQLVRESREMRPSCGKSPEDRTRFSERSATAATANKKN